MGSSTVPKEIIDLPKLKSGGRSKVITIDEGSNRVLNLILAELKIISLHLSIVSDQTFNQGEE